MTVPAGGKSAVGDKLWAGKQRPVEEFIFLAYGKQGVSGHEKALRDTMTRRQIWDLVAYTRSLAEPPLTKDEMDAILPVFGANCAVCHGTKGDGDGPLMRNLQPMPANFQTFARFYDRDDDTLFDHIANGIRWEGMPNFLGKTDVRNKTTFDQKYIRKLVAYVRAFHFSNTPTITPSSVGGTESLPQTAPKGSDLGLKNLTQPEQAPSPPKDYNAPGQNKTATPAADIPTNPSESAPAPTTPSLQPNDTGTRPIDSPSSTPATAPKH